MASPSGERLHFLDWLRVVLVGFVVYAHLIFCGAQVGRPADHGAVDNRNFNVEFPQHLAIRWNSVARQWCIPLLFWISGAACALSFDGSAPRFFKGLRRILTITAVGVAGNAAMWLLGPRKEECSFREPCVNEGVFFDFTEDPYSGDVEPYVNQMWYTIALLLVTGLNWPLLKASVDTAPPWSSLAVQFGLATAVYAALIFGAAGDSTGGQHHPSLLGFWLVANEALFLVLAVLAVSKWRPLWLNLRLLHYACAAVAVLQVAGSECVPTPVVDDISAGYVLYLTAGINKWFQLGAIMASPRREDPAGAGVEPVVSTAWPVALILLVLCTPSTNWVMAGVLPYPFYARRLDRLLYVGGTVLAMFIADRCSYGFQCRPVPRLVSTGALVLYTFQVVLLTVFLHAFGEQARQELEPRPSSKDGAHYLVIIFLLSILTSLAISGAFMLLIGRRRIENSPPLLAVRRGGSASASRAVEMDVPAH